MSSTKSTQMVIAIRIRGELNLRRDIRDALESWRLRKVHTAVSLKADQDVIGSLRKLKDVIVWGEIDEKTLVELLKRRAIMKGDVQLSEEFIKEKLNLQDFHALAKALLNNEIEIKKMPGLVPYFRLAPPSRGYILRTERRRRGKREIVGYAGASINELVMRMV